jgi:hypothetical protein
VHWLHGLVQQQGHTNMVRRRRDGLTNSLLDHQQWIWKIYHLEAPVSPPQRMSNHTMSQSSWVIFISRQLGPVAAAWLNAGATHEPNW